MLNMGLSNASSRMRRRWMRHHLPLALFAAAGSVTFAWAGPHRDWITAVSFGTAYPALALLGFTLILGAWWSVRGKAHPVSSDLRRDVGIWAGILTVVHAAVGQCVHLRGRPWLYYIYSPAEHHRGLRHDLFGFNNYAGLVGTLLVIALFAMSNDLSLRILGAAKWKSLQRWNYAVFALAAAHTFGYETMEKQKIGFVATALLCVGLTIALQAAGFTARRRAARERAIA
jgi:sulfoxide reductase heme-binding subunit YedZ